MSSQRYADAFKVAGVAERLGVTTHSLHAWRRKFVQSGIVQRTGQDQRTEVMQLSAELRGSPTNATFQQGLPRTWPR